ncbi:MAG: nucleotidyltransferase family protein [Ilumatobacteraceae bacterium]
MHHDDVRPKVFGIVLSAGAGSRFRGPSHKLTSTLRGRPVIAWAVDAARAADLAGVIVVTGAIPLDLPERVIVVHNERWAEGQAMSLQLGIATAIAHGADAVVVGLGDQPFITPDTWTAVAAADAPIVVATYDGVRGNPVRLDHTVWPLLPATGDHGARSLMALRPDLVSQLACSGSAADIDTMEDLRQWNSSTNSP